MYSNINDGCTFRCISMVLMLWMHGGTLKVSQGKGYIGIFPVVKRLLYGEPTCCIFAPRTAETFLSGPGWSWVPTANYSPPTKMESIYQDYNVLNVYMFIVLSTSVHSVKFTENTLVPCQSHCILCPKLHSRSRLITGQKRLVASLKWIIHRNSQLSQ